MTNQRTQAIPIYQKLFDYYKEKIINQEFHPGSRIDSINDIQRTHQVSRETAKTVLKKLSEDGLIIQRPGKGSFVVDLGPRKKIWGIIVPFFSAQIEELINTIRFIAWQNKRRVEYYVDYNDWQEEIRIVGKMINQRYEAVIVVPTFQDEAQTAPFYRRLRTGGTLVSLIDHTMVGSFFPYVIQSYDLGVKRATDYLLEKTTGTIGFVKNSIWLRENTVQEMMQETFWNMVSQHDPTRKKIMIEDIYALSRKFVREENLAGFFCCDDTAAVRILGRLNAWEIKVPEQVALVSYGNTDLARFFTPAITAIDPHHTEMVEILTKIIKKHLSGNDVSFCQYVLQPDLVIRET